MPEQEKLMEVCKTIVGTSKLMFHDARGHLASGDLDTARDGLSALKAAIDITTELECPRQTIDEIKTMHRDVYDTYRGMLTSRVETLLRQKKVV